MGDVLSLVEKAEEAMNDDDAEALMKRIMQQKYDFNDWLKQTKTMTKMGGMSSVTRLVPGKSLQLSGAGRVCSHQYCLFRNKHLCGVSGAKPDRL